MKSANNDSYKDGFKIVGNNYSIWKTFRSIKSYTEKNEYCSICGSKLKQDFTLIPISTGQSAKVDGLSCRKCACIYTATPTNVRSLLKDNSYAKGFTLDGNELWNFTYLKRKKKRTERQRARKKEQLSLLSKVKSSEIIFTVRFCNKELKNVIIVNNPIDAAPQNYIFYYASEDGQEFLSAAFAKDRNGYGKYNSLKFHKIGEVLFKDREEKSFLKCTLCDELIIKPDGGYRASVKSSNYEVVDALLYSPWTKKYELIRVTRCIDDNYCFVDISRYRTFVRKYGNPQICISPETNCGSMCNYSNLNEESILRSCGYTVNQNDNFPSKERHSLLADLIDLDIIGANRIARLLDFLIRINTRHDVARSKWQEDKEFVENYEPNPQRFLIINGQHYN